MKLRNRIYRLLIDRGISETRFAKQIGINQGNLNKIKNGKVVPNILTALVIARGLGVTVDAVFYLDAPGAAKGPA